MGVADCFPVARPSQGDAQPLNGLESEVERLALQGHVQFGEFSQLLPQALPGLGTVRGLRRAGDVGSQLVRALSQTSLLNLSEIGREPLSSLGEGRLGCAQFPRLNLIEDVVYLGRLDGLHNRHGLGRGLANHRVLARLGEEVFVNGEGVRIEQNHEHGSYQDRPFEHVAPVFGVHLHDP